MRRLGAIVALMLISVSAGQARQTDGGGLVRIMVRDATDLPIQGADVTLVARHGAAIRGTTDDRGEASFDRVPPGEYAAHIESPGFKPFKIDRLSLRGGTRVSRHVILQVAAVVEQLEVKPNEDDQRRLNAFINQLSPEQLAALPEDPEELALVLLQLVGDDADIRVDGFSGGRLPPGSQINEVRIRYDGGAASSGAGPRVEIRTTPGGDRWRNDAGVSVRDESLNARDPFSGARPVGQTRQYTWNVNGPVVKNRTGLSVRVDGAESMGNQAIRAAAPGGLYSRLLEQPSRRIGIWTRMAHQFTPGQSIRIDLGHALNEARNQGITEFDLPERAVTTRGSDGALRIGHHAELRSGAVSDLRFGFAWESNDASSLNTRTIQVLDAFTSGGAQQQGGTRTTTLEIEHDLEFTVNRVHRISVGGSVNGSRYSGDENSNAVGTFTFANLEAFAANRPSTFTQRLGDPSFAYSMYRFGWHVQDDYRVRRDLMVNLGFRHDFQTHVRDWANFSPRIGVSWTPSRKTRTALRASIGVSQSSLGPELYRQLLLVNGLQQSDLVIVDPGFPNPLSEGVVEAAPPRSVIRAQRSLELPFTRRYSVGLDQPMGRYVRVRTTFIRQNGQQLFRSRDANAPVDGIRPNPSYRRITELESTARSLQQSLQTDLTLAYPARRLSANVSYTFGETMNETDGPFSLPPDSFDLTGEWGPARGDVRHRLNIGVNTDLPGHFRVNAMFRAQSAPAYTITTGVDANGDGIYSERPPGVGRNSARGQGTKNVDLTTTWGVNVGERRSAETDAQAGQATGGARAPLAARSNYLVRFELFARARNVLNFVNPRNFSGVMTSPFFGLPTAAGEARNVVVGTRVWF